MIFSATNTAVVNAPQDYVASVNTNANNVTFTTHFGLYSQENQIPTNHNQQQTQGVSVKDILFGRQNY
jgi:hypothetical protein